MASAKRTQNGICKQHNITEIKDGQVIEDKIGKFARREEHFVQLFNEDTDILQRKQRRGNRGIGGYQQSLSEREMKDITVRLKNNNSPGANEIPAEEAKQGEDALNMEVCKLIKQI